jgi:rRNA-processing protein FCF1
MQQVLIDACGWVACIDAKLNIDQALENLLGPCEWLLLPSVFDELKRLQEERGRTKTLLLNLLETKSTRLGGEALLHTDDALLSHAQEHGCAVLTVDTDLKRRLYEANVQVIEVRQNNRLHLIDSL